MFFVADTQLYKRLCLSVRLSACGHKTESGKTSILKAFCECVCVEGGWVRHWSVVTPRHLFWFLSHANYVIWILRNFDEIFVSFQWERRYTFNCVLRDSTLIYRPYLSVDWLVGWLIAWSVGFLFGQRLQRGQWPLLSQLQEISPSPPQTCRLFFPAE